MTVLIRGISSCAVALSSSTLICSSNIRRNQRGREGSVENGNFSAYHLPNDVKQQVAKGCGDCRAGGRQGCIQRLLPHLQPTQVHSTSTLCLSGSQGVREEGLSRHPPVAAGLF